MKRENLYLSILIDMGLFHIRCESDPLNFTVMRDEKRFWDLPKLAEHVKICEPCGAQLKAFKKSIVAEG